MQGESCFSGRKYIFIPLQMLQIALIFLKNAFFGSYALRGVSTRCGPNAPLRRATREGTDGEKLFLNLGGF